MYFTEAKPSTVIKQIVGAGGITKGQLGVLSSGTVVPADAAIATAATVIGIAVDTYSATEVGQFELASNRIIRAAYTGTASNLALGKVYDLSDASTVNIDDVTGGVFFCVAYDSKAKTVDGIIVAANRAI